MTLRLWYTLIIKLLKENCFFKYIKFYLLNHYYKLLINYNYATEKYIAFSKLSYSDFLTDTFYVYYREDPSERYPGGNDVPGLHVLLCHSYQFIHIYCRHGKHYKERWWRRACMHCGGYDKQ